MVKNQMLMIYRRLIFRFVLAVDYDLLFDNILIYCKLDFIIHISVKLFYHVLLWIFKMVYGLLRVYICLINFWITSLVCAKAYAFPHASKRLLSVSNFLTIKWFTHDIIVLSSLVGSTILNHSLNDSM